MPYRSDDMSNTGRIYEDILDYLREEYPEESEEELDEEELDKEISTVTHELNASMILTKQHKTNFFFMVVSFIWEYVYLFIITYFSHYFKQFYKGLQNP